MSPKGVSQKQNEIFYSYCEDAQDDKSSESKSKR